MSIPNTVPSLAVVSHSSNPMAPRRGVPGSRVGSSGVLRQLHTVGPELHVSRPSGGGLKGHGPRLNSGPVRRLGEVDRQRLRRRTCREDQGGQYYGTEYGPARQLPWQSGLPWDGAFVAAGVVAVGATVIRSAGTPARSEVTVAQ